MTEPSPSPPPPPSSGGTDPDPGGSSGMGTSSTSSGGPKVFRKVGTRTKVSGGITEPMSVATAGFVVYVDANGNGKLDLEGDYASSPERRLLLRLPPGRYVIHRRGGGSGGLATIAVGESEERKVEDKDFTAGSLELLAKKGGEGGEGSEVAADAPAMPVTPRPEVRNHELSAGWDMGANLRTGLVQGPRIGYAYAWQHFALSIGGGADFSGRALENKEEKLTGGFGRAGIEIRLPLGALTLRGGAGGRAGVLAQTITNTNPLLPTPDESQTAFVFGPEVLLALRLSLGQTLFADLGGTGSVMFLRESGSLRGITGAVAALTLGARF